MLFTFENNRIVLDEIWSMKDILYNFKFELGIFVMLLCYWVIVYTGKIPSARCTKVDLLKPIIQIVGDYFNSWQLIN